MRIEVLKKVRVGDHKWWITDFSKFQKHYPTWSPSFSPYSIIDSIIKYDQPGKFKILESYICACDYEYVLFKIRQAIKNKQRLLISPHCVPNTSDCGK